MIFIQPYDLVSEIKCSNNEALDILKCVASAYTSNIQVDTPSIVAEDASNMNIIENPTIQRTVK